jgi:hypothetical protein
MSKTGSTIVGVFLAGICPLLIFVMWWWTAAVVQVRVPGNRMLRVRGQLPKRTRKRPTKGRPNLQ